MLMLKGAWLARSLLHPPRERERKARCPLHSPPSFRGPSVRPFSQYQESIIYAFYDPFSALIERGGGGGGEGGGGTANRRSGGRTTTAAAVMIRTTILK